VRHNDSAGDGSVARGAQPTTISPVLSVGRDHPVEPRAGLRALLSPAVGEGRQDHGSGCATHGLDRCGLPHQQDRERSVGSTTSARHKGSAGVRRTLVVIV
jgi:hypothetical protein